MCEFLWMGFGAIMFILRIFIIEYPLRKEFTHEKQFISRWLNLLFWLLMIINFNSDIFKVCILISFPIFMFAALIIDIPLLFSLFKNRTAINRKKIQFWLIFDRLTLHIPIIVYVIVELLTISQPFFSDLSINEVFSGILLNFGIYFIFDPRKPWKSLDYIKKWYQYGIIVSNSLSAIIFLIYAIF